MRPVRSCQGRPVPVPATTATYSGEGAAGLDRAPGLNALTAQYYRRWRPVATEERLLVDLLITADWQLRRLRAGRQWRPPEPA
jgi:hypothetical protein